MLKLFFQEFAYLTLQISAHIYGVWSTERSNTKSILWIWPVGPEPAGGLPHDEQGGGGRANRHVPSFVLCKSLLGLYRIIRSFFTGSGLY